MKRAFTVAAGALVATLGLLLARRAVRALGPRLMERMMERYMPKMMDACFERMPLERRRFMLAHCRNMLDRVEAKYAAGDRQPVQEGARIVG